MAASIAALAEAQDRPGLETALAAVAARVDALASATVTFRNIVSDRVSETFMRTAELVSEQAAATAATRRDVARCLDAVAAVTDRVSSIEAELVAHRSEVMAALDAIADEVHGLRRRTPVRAAKPAKLDDDELQALADAVADSLRREPGRPATRPRRTRTS